MEPTLAIHKVQRNADPYHYEKYGTAAEQIVTALSGAVGTCATGELVYPLADGFNLTSDYGPRPVTVAGASSWHAAVTCSTGPTTATTGVRDPGGASSPSRFFQVTIKHPDGYDINYLHMWPEDVIVRVGDQVTAGQPIGATGNSGPSGGCHLDLRINVAGNTNPQLDSLCSHKTRERRRCTGTSSTRKRFYGLYGMELCGGAGECQRPSNDGTELPIR